MGFPVLPGARFPLQHVCRAREGQLTAKTDCSSSSLSLCSSNSNINYYITHNRCCSSKFCILMNYWKFTSNLLGLQIKYFCFNNKKRKKKTFTKRSWIYLTICCLKSDFLTIIKHKNKWGCWASKSTIKVVHMTWNSFCIHFSPEKGLENCQNRCPLHLQLSQCDARL